MAGHGPGHHRVRADLRLGGRHRHRDATADGQAQGLAAGLLNSAAQVGTALGIAVVVTVAAGRTGALAGAADPTPAQLVDGFRLAFLAAALVALLGALVTLLFVPKEPR